MSMAARRGALRKNKLQALQIVIRRNRVYNTTSTSSFPELKLIELRSYNVVEGRCIFELMVLADV